MTEKTKIVIAGLAKTGTTGLFYKIRNSLTGPVRELFEPTEFSAEPQDVKKVVLAKILVGRSKYADYEAFAQFDKTIHIVRDPRDQIISYLLYRVFQLSYIEDETRVAQFTDLLRMKESNPSSVSVLQLCTQQVRLFQPKAKRVATEYFTIPLTWAIEFSKRFPNYHILHYEDFVLDHLNGLAQYLGFPLKGQANVAKDVQHVVRTKGAGDWKNWFISEDVKFFRSNSTIRRFMNIFGYSDDWQLPKRQEIFPQFSSEYVARLIEKRRRLLKLS